MELSKILIGKNVNHNKLGTGTIIEEKEGYILVRFENEKVSKFVFPDIFEKFLSFEDEETQKIADKYLRMRKLILASKEKEKKQEFQKIDNELKIKHKEDLLKKQKAMMVKLAREKRKSGQTKILINS